MPRPLRYWNSYPPAHLQLAKNVAMAELPVRYGPFSQKDAAGFRSTFYRFREALRISPDRTPNSYPGRLYEMIQDLTSEIEHSDSLGTSYVVFNIDAVSREMERLDPAGAQGRRLAKEAFIAAQQASTITASPFSEPMFDEVQMEERIAEIHKPKDDEVTSSDHSALETSKVSADFLTALQKRRIDNSECSYTPEEIADLTTEQKLTLLSEGVSKFYREHGWFDERLDAILCVGNR